LNFVVRHFGLGQNNVVPFSYIRSEFGLGKTCVIRSAANDAELIIPVLGGLFLSGIFSDKESRCRKRFNFFGFEMFSITSGRILLSFRYVA
jgi:hypothetical protein